MGRNYRLVGTSRTVQTRPKLQSLITYSSNTTYFNENNTNITNMHKTYVRTYRTLRDTSNSKHISTVRPRSARLPSTSLHQPFTLLRYRSIVFFRISTNNFLVRYYTTVADKEKNTMWQSTVVEWMTLWTSFNYKLCMILRILRNN